MRKRLRPVTCWRRVALLCLRQSWMSTTPGRFESTVLGMAPPDSVCAVSPAGVRPQSWEDDFSRINTICEKKKRQDGADCTKRADGAPHPSGDHAGALLLSSAAQRMLVHDNPNSSASGGGVMLGASSAMPQKRGSASADDGKVRDSRKSKGAHMHRAHRPGPYTDTSTHSGQREASRGGARRGRWP